MKKQIEPQLLNIQQSGAFLGVNPGTIRRWAKNKKIKGQKVGSRGDWRFTKNELLTMLKSEPDNKASKKTFTKIKKFLIENALNLQKMATQHHKILLDTDKLIFLEKHQKQHSKILKLLAAHVSNLDKGLPVFKKFGEQFAKEAVKDGLSIEQAVDGTIFLKEAIWEKLEQSGLLNELTTQDLNNLSKIMAAYIDVLSSKIAFTYHEYYTRQIEKEKIDAKSAQSRYYRIFMQAPMPIAILKGADLVYEFSNPQNNSALGVENPIGKSLKKLFPINENKAIIKQLEKVYKTGKPFHAKGYPLYVTLPKKGKQTIYIEAVYQAFKDKENKVEGIITTGFDVTEQILARQKAQESEKRLEFLSYASKILASSLDYTTTLNSIAKVAVKTLADWCTVDLLDQNGRPELVALAHTDPKQVKWAKAYRRANPVNMKAASGLPHVIKTGKSELYATIDEALLLATIKDTEEIALVQKLHFVSAMVIPIRRGKETIGAITFISTQDEHHYTKQDVAFAEEIASRASLAIENARLYTQAQKAIQLRDEFISVASHELKTPVTSLKMYTQVVKDKIEKSGNGIATYPLTKMDEQIRKLTVLMNDLLDVSKVQLGQLEFHKESFDLNQLVKSMIELVQPISQKHTILLEGTINRHVYGDKDRIGQVITNLLTNAIKYSPMADKIEVQLTAEKEGAVVTVQDYGIGIDTDHQKKIFERFYRVNSDEEKTFPGLGLGLYISYQFIQRHGGIMRVVSKKNKGSQFSFTLPYTAHPDKIIANKARV